MSLSLRIERLINEMRSENVEAVMIFRPENIFYFSSFMPQRYSQCVFIIPDIMSPSRPLLLISEFESGLIDRRRIAYDLRTFRQYPISFEDETRDFIRSLIAVIKEYGLERSNIGIDADAVPGHIILKLQKALPALTPIDISKQVYQLRMVKDHMELEKIRKATEIADRAVRIAIEILRPGMTELEACMEIEEALRSSKIQFANLKIRISSGVRTVHPRTSPTNRRISTDDPIVVNVTSNFQEYYAKAIRTFFIGKISDRYKQLLSAIDDVHSTLLEVLKPGTTAKDVDSVVRRVLGKRGLLRFFPHPTGHGIGLEVFEPPVLALNDHTLMTKNMVLSIEPGIYVPGMGGVRTGNLMLISEDAPIILNELPENIMAHHM
ncbi:MAG: M24 family metallopeptidase [Candidatus Baldrarchaeia archaeon]